MGIEIYEILYAVKVFSDWFDVFSKVEGNDNIYVFYPYQLNVN